MTFAWTRTLAATIAAATCLLPVAVAAAEPFRYVPSAAVVERLSTELARYARAAAREERSSPVRPAPSRELAYLLLEGLAAHGPAPEPLDAATIADLTAESSSPVLGGHDPRTRRTIVRLSPRLWIVFAETTVQDKALTFIEAVAVLYVKTRAGWTQRGSGTAAWPPSA